MISELDDVCMRVSVHKMSINYDDENTTLISQLLSQVVKLKVAQPFNFDMREALPFY